MKLTEEQLEKAAKAAYCVCNPTEGWRDSLYHDPWKNIVRAVIAAIEPEPVEVPQDLVDRMIWEWFGDRTDRPEPLPDHRRRMTAALRVALEDERVLGDPTIEEIRIRHACVEQKMPAISNFLANRRARLLKAKTPERETAEKIVKSLRCVDLTNPDYQAAVVKDIEAMIAKLREQEAQS